MELDVGPAGGELLAVLFEVFSDVPTGGEEVGNQPNFGDVRMSNALLGSLGNGRRGELEIGDLDDIRRLAGADHLGQRHEIGIRFGSAAAVGDQ